MSDQQLQDKTIRLLVDKIYNEKDKIINSLKERGYGELLCSSIFVRPEDLQRETRNELENLEKSDVVQKMLGWQLITKQDHGLGIILFSLASGLEEVHELDLDCRGWIDELDEKAFKISIAEIKSSRSLSEKAIKQLGRSLATLESALKVCK